MPDDELDVIIDPSESREHEGHRSLNGRRLGVALVLVLVLAAVGGYWLTKNGGDGDSAAACNTGDLFERENANAVVFLRPDTDPQSVGPDLQPDRLRVAEMITRPSGPADRFQVHVRFSAGSTAGDLDAFVSHARRVASVSEVTIGLCPLK